MSSERLYYTDPYLVEFDAVVRDVERQGEHWIVTLDRTAFYPTSGGQPYDTGTIDSARVLEVFEGADDAVVHRVDRELEKNCRVRGHVDWARRFDHMQQHTGQHLLSAAFEHEIGARTVAFHLGQSVSTIDLDKEPSPEEIFKVEQAANKVLWEDREVCINFATASEAAKLPLRKDPTRTGELRIIEIKGYDMSACGGTHVNRTGAIGMIAIPGFERFKGGARIEFVCGVRALQAYRADRNVVTAGVRSLSVLPDELPAAIERMRDANRQQQKGVEAVYDRLATFEAAALASAAETVGAHKLVAAAVSGWDAAGLKKLASAIAANPGTIVVLMTDTDPIKGGHQPPPSMIVVARSQDVTVDAGAVLQHLIGRFGGKGGGKGSMAQGGGLTGDSRDILSAAREHIRSA